MAKSWIYVMAGLTAALTLLGVIAIVTAMQQQAFVKIPITVTGEIVCLPHKGPTHTDECRFGLLGDDGNHYALDVDEKDQWIFFDAIDSRPEYTLGGNMTPGSVGTYDVVGTIDVNYVKQR